MNASIAIYVVRFVVLFLAQTLIFSQIDEFQYLHLFIFPLFLMLLPIQISKSALLLIGFGSGLLLDIFENTMGYNAAIGTLLAFIRPFLLKIIEPSSGYENTPIPSSVHFGMAWFIKYAAIFMFIYIFYYFLLDAFSLALFSTVLLKTVVSFFASMILVIISMVVFNPKN